MKNIKLLLGLVSSVIAVTPFVAADLKSGPEIFVLPIIALSVLAGFFVGAVFLILWIIKKVRSKNVKVSKRKK